jgi:hypothetical protein
MATTTNYGWTTPDDTDLVKDGAAAIRTLGSSVDTTTKNLNPETTTGDISYRSATANVNTRLPLGTAGQVLKVNSGATAPEWATDASGMTNPMTTTGDTIYSSSGSTPARLGIGTAGQVLQVNSGATAPEWATPAGGTPAFVGCSVYKSANQSISNTTTTAITFDTELKDTDGFHSTSSNTSRMTIPSGKAGLYLITGQINFASNASGYRSGEVHKNGSLVAQAFVLAPVTGGWTGGSVSHIIELAVGDYVELIAWQSSGGSLNVNGGATYGAAFQIQYLGA